MTGARNVLIVGGGIGGLSAAISLRGIGVEVDLIEKSPRWSVDGVGIIQPANALRALDEIGVAQSCIDEGFPFEGTRTYDADGANLLNESRFARLNPDLPAMNGITRPKFHNILIDAAKAAGTNVRLGVTVSAIVLERSSARVEFSDGASRTYGLVVAADGIHSQLRETVFGGETRPRYAGQVVWRCNVPRPEGIDCITQFLRDGGSAGKAGMVPIGPELVYIHTGEAWPEGEQMPREPLDVLMRKQLAGHEGIIGELRDRFITDPEQVVVRPLESILMPAPWFRGRVVLIGDAAHAPTSKLGQGAAQAIEDGIVLAQELAVEQTVEQALEAYMERRYERCKFIVESSLQVCRWELGLDKDTLDHVGITAKSMEVTALPI
jgi:2-polyprenyl-6-methoxyphenol hydroxylase-like FAD-dependent oxidoreductase